MPLIKFDDYSIHYCVEGFGPDVLMIHGWASSHRMWERCLKRLALSGFRAWALDLPGCGESDSYAAASRWYSVANLTSAVETFIERVGIRSVSLIGHSMGGAIALELGRRRPELTGVLVLVAPAISGRLGFLHTLLDSPFRRLLLGLSRQHTTLGLWGQRTLLGASEFIRNPALRRDVQDLAHTTPEAFMGGLSAVLDFDFTEYLRVIGAPTLVVVGTRDMTLPSSEGELAASQIPGARLVKMRGVGHQPVDERPEEFDRVLVEFLQDHRVQP